MSKIFVAQGYKVFYNLLSKKQFLSAVGTRELCQVREVSSLRLWLWFHNCIHLSKFIHLYLLTAELIFHAILAQ